MFVLALASLLPFPVRHMQVVVHIAGAVLRVPENRVEKGLRRQQGVPKELEKGLQQLILLLGMGDIGHERSRQRHPVTASVHLDARWQLAISYPPHVRVALHEGLVQTLLLDELLRLPAVALDKVPPRIGT